MKPPIHLRPASWDLDKVLLRKLRSEVFIQEQGVPEDLEWDEYDAVCQHVLAFVDGVAVGTGRIKPDGHIGRMAVSLLFRQRGIGREILLYLLSYAERELGCEKVYLHAQVSATGFYEKCGFQICSEPFMDAGIPHRTMVRFLKQETSKAGGVN